MNALNKILFDRDGLTKQLEKSNSDDNDIDRIVRGLDGTMLRLYADNLAEIVDDYFIRRIILRATPEQKRAALSAVLEAEVFEKRKQKI